MYLFEFSENFTTQMTLRNLSHHIVFYISENVSSIYTSGRKCNFKGKGCDAEHLQPINVNGWFWAGAGNARIPRTDQPAENSHWSRTGE